MVELFPLAVYVPVTVAIAVVWFEGVVPFVATEVFPATLVVYATPVSVVYVDAVAFDVYTALAFWLQVFGLKVMVDVPPDTGTMELLMVTPEGVW